MKIQLSKATQLQGLDPKFRDIALLLDNLDFKCDDSFKEAGKRNEQAAEWIRSDIRNILEDNENKLTSTLESCNKQFADRIVQTLIKIILSNLPSPFSPIQTRKNHVSEIYIGDLLSTYLKKYDGGKKFIDEEISKYKREGQLTRLTQEELNRIELGVPIIVDKFKGFNELSDLQRKYPKQELDFQAFGDSVLFRLGEIDQVRLAFLSVPDYRVHTHMYQIPLEPSTTDTESASCRPNFRHNGVLSFTKDGSSGEFAWPDNDESDHSYTYIRKGNNRELNYKLREFGLIK